MRLPVYGMSVADLEEVWKKKGEFVPVERAYVLHIEHALEQLGLEGGDPRYDWIVALAETVVATDAKTGLYKGDLWETNLDLAKYYAKENYSDHKPAVYAARKGGDEFGVLVVAPGAVAEMEGDFTNLSGLNPGLSSEAEIASDREKLTQRAGERRFFAEAESDQRTSVADVPQHSAAGFKRADDYVKAMVGSLVHLAQAFTGPITIEAIQTEILQPFHESQSRFNSEIGLDCIERFKKDHGDGPARVGTGLAVAAAVMHADNNWEAPSPHAWEDAINAAKDAHCQYTVDRMPDGKIPISRIADLEGFEGELGHFIDQHAIQQFTPAQHARPDLRIQLHQIVSSKSTAGHTRPEAPWYLQRAVGIIGEVLAVNGPEHTDKAAGRKSPSLEQEGLDRYLAVVNDVMNTALNGSGRVLHLTGDVRSSAEGVNN
jgi:hypothetical protein